MASLLDVLKARQERGGPVLPVPNPLIKILEKREESLGIVPVPLPPRQQKIIHIVEDLAPQPPKYGDPGYVTPPPPPPHETIGDIYSPVLVDMIAAQQAGVPYVPEEYGPGTDWPIYSPTLVAAIEEQQAAAIARGEVPTPGGLFNFDSPPFRDIGQMPVVGPVLGIPGSILGGLGDIGKYVLYAGAALAAVYIIGKVVGKK